MTFALLFFVVNVYVFFSNQHIFSVSRIAVFSIRVLKDERIVIIAEQRPESTEEEVKPCNTLP